MNYEINVICEKENYGVTNCKKSVFRPDVEKQLESAKALLFAQKASVMSLLFYRDDCKKVFIPAFIEQIEKLDETKHGKYWAVQVMFAE